MKFIKRIHLALVAGVLVLAGLAGCSDDSSNAEGGDGDSSAAQEGGGDLSEMEVAYLTVSQACEYCARQAEAFVDAMEGAGVEVTMSVTEFDAAEQTQQLNQAVSTQPDVIVVWPTDNTSIIPALDRIKQTTDIPVVVTTYLPETDDTSLWTAWVGPDDYQLGVQAAESLIDGLEQAGLGDSGSVIEVTGIPGGGSTIARGEGFQATLTEQAPYLKIVGEQPGDWDQTIATTAAANLFSQYGNEKIIGVFAHADNMLAGALVASERAGYKPGSDLIAVGSDCTVEGYGNVQAGKQFATNLQDPVVDGQTIAEITQAVLQGDSVENITYIDTPVITKENISECDSAVGK